MKLFSTGTLGMIGAMGIGTMAGLWPPLARADAQQAQLKKAETVMIHECRKEFPDAAKGKSLDQLDQWAEASETATGSAAFKKSRCFEAHEKWEKLAQKNEWADPDSKRMPASPQKPVASP